MWLGREIVVVFPPLKEYALTSMVCPVRGLFIGGSVLQTCVQGLNASTLQGIQNVLLKGVTG
jgi:hypothetical protein